MTDQPQRGTPGHDPVLVTITDDHVAKALGIVSRALHHPETFFGYEDDRASIQFAMWLLDRIGAQFSYINEVQS